VFGIYVEPIKSYLDVLPIGKNIIKENCAIFDYAGEIEFNAVIRDNPRYFSNREMSEIVKDPQREAEYVKTYGNSGQSSFLDLQNLKTQKIKVKTITLEQLFLKHDVTEIQNLKIDVEGYEEKLLMQLYNLMKSNKVKITHELKFEYNYLSNLEELNNITRLICEEFGFSMQYQCSLPWNEDMVCTKIGVK
jgi:FkbM family methyltransferase